jgi:hypothetical protein
MRDSLEAPAKRSQRGIGRNQLLKQNSKIVRFLNRQSGLGEQTFKVLLNGLLAMKANLIAG